MVTDNWNLFDKDFSNTCLFQRPLYLNINVHACVIRSHFSMWPTRSHDFSYHFKGLIYSHRLSLAWTSTGIDADASNGETSPGYFNSKLVYWYKCGILNSARATPFLQHRTVRDGTLSGFLHYGIFFPENSLRFPWHMMTSSNGNIFFITGHLCGEFTGDRWIPRKRPVTGIWCFLWFAPEWTVE